MNSFSKWSKAAFLVASVGCGISTKPASNTAGPEKNYADRCDGAPSGKEQLGQAPIYAVRGSAQDSFRASALITLSSGETCSSVLVSRKSLVTAAHCFEKGRTVQRIDFSDSPKGVPLLAEAQRTVIHPDYASATQQGKTLESDPSLVSVDVAVVVLKDEVADREPAPVPGSPVHLQSGKLVELVGYGDTGAGAGLRRLAYSNVGRSVAEETRAGVTFHDLIVLDSVNASGACPGDSGAGVFVRDGDRRQLLGVVSGVNDLLYPGLPVRSCGRCPRGLGIVVPLSPHSAFIAGAEKTK